MRFFDIFPHTGFTASNLKVARRLNRALRNKQKLGECTVMEWDGVLRIDAEFLRIVAQGLRPEKNRFGGIYASAQNLLPRGFEQPPSPFLRQAEIKGMEKQT